MAMETTTSGDPSSKKNQKKFPKRIHKAEKEKMKRDHLNELFLALANSLELSDHNSGKAAVLTEATRFLKDMLAEIESLKNQNTELLSESHYVTVEKNELVDENSALESQIGDLQTQLNSRASESQLDLNIAPPDCQNQEAAPHGNNNGVVMFPQPHVQHGQQGQIVNPLSIAACCPSIQSYPELGTQLHTSRNISIVSKPHARYPTPADTWPFLEKP